MVDASEHSIHKPSVVSDKKLVPSLDDQLDNVHIPVEDHMINIILFITIEGGWGIRLLNNQSQQLIVICRKVH